MIFIKKIKTKKVCLTQQNYLFSFSKLKKTYIANLRY
jgi:hypothetical protein